MNNQEFINKLVEEYKFARFGNMYTTYTYSLFKIIKGNRGIDRLHVIRLAKRFKKELYQIPILVNEKLEIIDGQHRWSAIKYLFEEEGIVLPVYFVIQYGKTAKDAADLNLTGGRKWSIRDHVDSEVSFGNKEYILLTSLMDKYDIKNTSTMLDILYTLKKLPRNKVTSMLKNGTMTITDVYDQLVNVLDKLSLFETFEHCKTKKFMDAALCLISSKDYNHEQMIKKWDSFGAGFSREKDVYEYVRKLVEDVYSMSVKSNSKTENRLQIIVSKKNINVCKK